MNKTLITTFKLTKMFHKGLSTNYRKDYRGKDFDSS